MDNRTYKLMNWPLIEEVVYSECSYPQNVLGMHEVSGGFLIQAFFPGAENAFVHCLSNNKLYKMSLADEEGFFAYFSSAKKPFLYDYKVVTDGKEETFPEVYNNPSVFWTNVLEKLNEGSLYEAYKYFGAHVVEKKGVLGTEFTVFAPNAVRVSVVGDFNHWDGRINQMCRLNDEGVYSLFIPGVSVGALYKFEIKLRNGICFLKRDPFSFMTESGKGDAAIVSSPLNFEEFRFKRTAAKKREKILTVSLSEYVNSGKCRDLNKTLISICEKKKANAVLFKDLGKSVDPETSAESKVSFYAPDSEGLQLSKLIELIKMLHENGIRVYSEFDIGGFLSDSCGLRGFDGHNLYEASDYEDGNRLLFNLGSPYVREYLYSYLDYFVKVLSLDGYALTGAEKYLNDIGIYFLKELNQVITTRYSRITAINASLIDADFAGKPVSEGGLGFTKTVDLR